MRMIMRSFFSCLCLATLLGCGPAEPVATIEETVPASGTLSYQGKPLPDFLVTVYPTDGRRAASGKTDSEGHFTLGTNGADDGAPPGTHKVTVTFESIPLTGEPGKEEFVRPSQPSVVIPKKFGDPESSGITIDIPPEGSSELKIELN